MSGVATPTFAAALWVAAGSAIGGVVRYLIGAALAARSAAFPVGTLLVNVTGAFLLGLLVRVLGDQNASLELRLFLTIGICGGYTTFSTFSLETVRLLDAGAHARAALYVLASVVLSAAAVVAGLAAGRLADRAG